jgi:hypothetical protein
MRKRGLRTFILTHEEAATQNLFEIVQRYHNNCPAHLAPHTGASNAKELNFDEIDSGYKVGTAGTKAVGRSSTIQLFHGSEVAFWPFADTHADGVLQAVPNEDNTEIILESTANGIGNFFHQTWRDAGKGKNDYIAIFVPWYWSEEYQTSDVRDQESISDAENPTSDVRRLTPEEREYGELYGLTPAQLAWRRQKIAELKDAALFKQEYPGNAAAANRRAEMWMRSREWLEDPAGVQIPDSDTLHADACGPSYRYDSHTRLVLERKEDMRRRGVPSPDEWDAVALTFAEQVAPVSFRRQIAYPPLGIA